MIEGIEDLIECLFGDGDIDCSPEDVLDGGDYTFDDTQIFDSMASEGVSDGFNEEMSQALNEFNNESIDFSSTDSISFTSNSHHEPFPDETTGNGEDISFGGSGDKYTDNEYNRQAADKWLQKEKDCLAKGDISGASAAHSTAMSHIKRIKK